MNGRLEKVSAFLSGFAVMLALAEPLRQFHVELAHSVVGTAPSLYTSQSMLPLIVTGHDVTH